MSMNSLEEDAGDYRFLRMINLEKLQKICKSLMILIFKKKHN
jgi:hypothetical protein